MGALDYIKAAIELARKAGQVEIQKQLMDAREEFNDLREANVALTAEVARLKEQLKREQSVFYLEPWYYTSSEDEEEDGPFCPHCYDTKRILVRALPQRFMGAPNGDECPACKLKQFKAKGETAQSFEPDS